MFVPELVQLQLRGVRVLALRGRVLGGRGPTKGEGGASGRARTRAWPMSTSRPAAVGLAHASHARIGMSRQVVRNVHGAAAGHLSGGIQVLPLLLRPAQCEVEFALCLAQRSLQLLYLLQLLLGDLDEPIVVLARVRHPNSAAPSSRRVGVAANPRFAGVGAGQGQVSRRGPRARPVAARSDRAMGKHVDRSHWCGMCTHESRLNKAASVHAMAPTDDGLAHGGTASSTRAWGPSRLT